jgi:DNA-directed RNA polymerase specialized sigma24 family protein
MTPADSQSPKRTRDKSSGSPQPRTTHAQWTLTQHAFDNLLTCLSPDRDEAGRQYENSRARLVRFFESRSIDSAEARADDTINRVARRIDEGKQIDNLMAYLYRTAYLVFLEALKEPEHTEIDLEIAPAITPEPAFEDSEEERRQRCFDECLHKLTSENRELILGYYQDDGGGKIEFRKQLADTLRIPLNALRIRAHRIRMNLERCIDDCLGQLA